MAYKLTDTDVIIRLSYGAMIPPDERNTDYQEYLRWYTASKKNEPLPYVAPEPIEMSAEEKLASAGLSVDELKTLLDSATPPAEG